MRKAYAIRFPKGSYYPITFGERASALYKSKQVGGRVVTLTKERYKKIYGNHDWGYG